MLTGCAGVQNVVIGSAGRASRLVGRRQNAADQVMVARQDVVRRIVAVLVSEKGTVIQHIVS